MGRVYACPEQCKSVFGKAKLGYKVGGTCPEVVCGHSGLRRGRMRRVEPPNDEPLSVESMHPFFKTVCGSVLPCTRKWRQVLKVGNYLGKVPGWDITWKGPSVSCTGGCCLEYHPQASPPPITVP